MRHFVGDRVRFDWSDPSGELYVRGEGEIVRINKGNFGKMFPYRVAYDHATVCSTDPVDTIPGMHGDFRPDEISLVTR